jgi:uncharacterized protein YjbI with pentapeptide repeats
MTQSTKISNTLIKLSLTLMLSSSGVALVAVFKVRGGWWMLPAIICVLSAVNLGHQLRSRRQEYRARQALIQVYLDQLLLAQTPDERQPIIEAMSTQQLLRGIRLSSFDLEDLDLSYADLNHADLSGATLSGTNLTSANLTGATLSYATLTYTTLSGAILKGANLRGVNLRASDLRQADLTDAFLRGANLENTDLNGAVLHNAQLHGTNLWDANLTDAQLGGAVLTRAILPNGWANYRADSVEDSRISQQF